MISPNEDRTSEPPRESARSWLAHLGWALALLTTLLLIYISGAIAARVLYRKGILRDDSRTLNFVETVFTPVNYPYNQIPTFKAAFDGCVAIFVPKWPPEVVINRDPNLISHIIHDGLHFVAKLENTTDGTFLAVVIPKRYGPGSPLPPSPLVRAKVKMTDDSVTEGALQEVFPQAGNAGSVDVRYRLPLRKGTSIRKVFSVTVWIGDQVYELYTF